MSKTIHLSIGVHSISDSVNFFTTTLNGRITHQEETYTNIDLFGLQLTLKPGMKVTAGLTDFHFGFNMSLTEFDEFAEKIVSEHSQFVQMEPQVVDGGTPMERKKMYLKSPSGYLIELKGYK